MKTLFSMIVGLAVLGLAAPVAAAEPASLGQEQLQCLQLEPAAIPDCLLATWSGWLDRTF
ncbi:hypothetical protein HF319_08200 [Xanthomonas sp. Kuri4-1]